MGGNCALGLEYGPRPSASGRTQDLEHSFFPIRTSRPVNTMQVKAFKCGDGQEVNCWFEVKTGVKQPALL